MSRPLFWLAFAFCAPAAPVAGRYGFPSGKTFVPDVFTSLTDANLHLFGTSSAPLTAFNCNGTNAATSNGVAHCDVARRHHAAVAIIHSPPRPSRHHNTTPCADSFTSTHPAGKWLGSTSSFASSPPLRCSLLWIMRSFVRLYDELCMAFGSEQRQHVGLLFHVLWWFTSSRRTWLALATMNVVGLAYALKVPGWSCDPPYPHGT